MFCVVGVVAQFVVWVCAGGRVGIVLVCVDLFVCLVCF